MVSRWPNQFNATLSGCSSNCNPTHLLPSLRWQQIHCRYAAWISRHLSSMKTRQRENEKLTDSLLLCLAHSLICDISSVNDPTAPSRDLSKNWLATSWHQVKTNIRFRELINGATLRLSFVCLRVSLPLSLSLRARVCTWLVITIRMTVRYVARRPHTPATLLYSRDSRRHSRLASQLLMSLLCVGKSKPWQH